MVSLSWQEPPGCGARQPRAQQGRQTSEQGRSGHGDWRANRDQTVGGEDGFGEFSDLYGKDTGALINSVPITVMIQPQTKADRLPMPSPKKSPSSSLILSSNKS